MYVLGEEAAVLGDEEGNLCDPKGVDEASPSSQSSVGDGVGVAASSHSLESGVAILLEADEVLLAEGEEEAGLL